MALTGQADECSQRRGPSGQTGERSRRDEDAERRKLVQGDFVGKMFGGRIAVLCTK